MSKFFTTCVVLSCLLPQFVYYFCLSWNGRRIRVLIISCLLPWCLNCLFICRKLVLLVVTLNLHIFFQGDSLITVCKYRSGMEAIWVCGVSDRLTPYLHVVSPRPISLLIVWLASWAGKMNQITRWDWLPKQARWSYLARSGLPAVSREKIFPLSQIINPLLTKLFRSRWLDIGLVLFLRVYGPRRTPSGSINTQEKNLANIQPSWPHAWSITHIYEPRGPSGWRLSPVSFMITGSD